jgi:tubulin polyglutamylase TTLL9
MKRRTWRETEQYTSPLTSHSELEWEMMWAEKDWIHEALDKIHLQPSQRVNHFRNHYEAFLLFSFP